VKKGAVCDQRPFWRKGLKMDSPYISPLNIQVSRKQSVVPAKSELSS